MGKPLGERIQNVQVESSKDRFLGANKKIQKKKKEATLDLETNQEEDLDNLKIQPKKDTARQIVQRRQNLYDREEDEEIEEDYNIEDAKASQKSGGNQDKISDIIVGLLFKNKINSKNAFEIPVVNVQDLSDFKNVNGDFAWKRLSSTLDAGAKVYGYRVDSLHSDTYRIRSGLNRSDPSNFKDQKGGDNEQNAEGENAQGDEEQEKKIQKRKFKGGESTLEKNLANINATKYDLEFDIDPLFQKTSAKFDDHGAKGLLMNTLKIDSDVSAILDSSKQQQFWKKRKQKKAIYGDTSSLVSLHKTFDDLFQSELCPEMTSMALDMRQNAKLIFDVSRIRENRKQGLLAQTNTEMRMQTQMLNGIVESERQIMNQIDAAIHNQPVDHLDATENDQFQSLMAATDPDRPASPADIQDEFYNEEAQYDRIFGQNNYNDSQEQIDAPGQSIDHLPRIDIEDEQDERHLITYSVSKAHTMQPLAAMNPILLKPLNYIHVEDNLSIIGNGKNSLSGAIGKNWMEPDSWKFPKKPSKPLLRLSDLLPELNIFRQKRQKPKEEGAVDFDMDAEEDFDSIVQSENSKFKTSYTKEVGMLPKDFHISNTLFSTFAMKDPSTLLQQQSERYQQDDDEYNNDGDYFDYNAEANGYQPFNPMNQALNEIAEKQATKAKNQMLIKELKSKLWDKLETRIPTTEPTDKSSLNNKHHAVMKIEKRSEIEEEQPTEICFSDVYDKLPELIGMQNRNRVSLQTCFVTILHLANEKTLRFERTEEEGDFFISRDLLKA